MKDGRSLFLLALATGAVFAGSLGAWAATKINSIEFNGLSDPNQIDIRADGPISVDKQENATDKQVVLEIRNATISPSASRKVDTSSFNSNLILISPYQVEGQDTVRVVLQLRDSGSVDVNTQAQGVSVTLPAPADSKSAQAAAAKSDAKAAPPAPDAAAPEDAAPKAATVTIDDSGQKMVGQQEAPEGKASTNLKKFMKSQETREFTGRPITLQVRDMQVSDIFQMISEASGFNIILSPDVTGKIPSLSLVEVPWDQALDVVLKSLNLSAERSHNILRVMSTPNYVAEKIQDAKLKEASLQAAPRSTRIFPISYASLDDIQKIIGTLLSMEAPTAASATAAKLAAAAPGGTAGVSGGSSTTPTAAASGSTGVVNTTDRSITSDKRTNSLIIRDVAENLERVQKLIEILDVQTPQVMIEGKVIEATESFGKSLSGSLAFGAGGGATTSYNSFMGGDPTNALLGSTVQSAAKTGGAFGMTFLPGVNRLNAILSMGETESKLRVIASPRAVVLNKEHVSITQGTPVLVPQVTYQNGVPTPITASVSANLSLSVTPQVTNDGNVRLSLTINRDVPSNQSVATRSINTEVVVESGNTLVLGGFFTSTSTLDTEGFPILRKLPLIGWLFGKEAEGSERSELFFFVTPQILNAKKAGIGA